METSVEVEERSMQVKALGTEDLLTKHLQGKKQEWDAITAHKEPLRLLDLPVDILQTILKELTHTNDLTSLALTHSALHGLVTPHIYARFDIVWPDANATFENRMGVDALTYGLATLVMAQDVFGEAPYQQQTQHQCQQCGYHFLRRLPNATTLRSLHISHIAEHVNGTVHSREAALQVLDIVALRPELELCYLGIQSQCFEILEYASPRKGSSPGDLAGDEIGHENDGPPPHTVTTHNPVHNHHDDSHDDEPDHGDGNDDSDFDAVSDDADELSDEGEGNEMGGASGANGLKPTWRLREILFYDDKISIFKARHGRL